MAPTDNFWGLLFLDRDVTLNKTRQKLYEVLLTYIFCLSKFWSLLEHELVQSIQRSLSIGHYNILHAALALGLVQWCKYTTRILEKSKCSIRFWKVSSFQFTFWTSYSSIPGICTTHLKVIAPALTCCWKILNLEVMDIFTALVTLMCICSWTTIRVTSGFVATIH